MVANVEQQKQREKEAYPDVFASTKELSKRIATLRQRLHEEDPQYKKTLFATHRAKRAIDAFLIGKDPSIERLPKSKQPAALERLRQRYSKDPGYIARVKASSVAQHKHEADYPQLFVSNEQINQRKKDRRKELSGDPPFKQLIKATAAAHHAHQDYLHEHDKLLGELKIALETSTATK